MTPTFLRRSSLAAAALTASLGFAAPAQAQLDNIVDTAVNNGSFTTLVTALQATGLDMPLSLPGRFTVFAPTDDAFDALPTGTLQVLLDPANVDLLTSILLYHVVDGGLTSTEVLLESFLTTLNPQRIDVCIDDQGNVFIDDAQILIVDVICSNGVIHVIDTVLQPSQASVLDTVVGNPDLSTLASVAGGFNSLVNALTHTSPRTIFAPSDAAFAAVPANRLGPLVGNSAALRQVLKYHVVPGRLYANEVIAAGTVPTLEGGLLTITTVGSDAFVNGIQISTPDIEAENGNIHIIDGVLLP